MGKEWLPTPHEQLDVQAEVYPIGERLAIEPPQFFIS